MVASKMQQRLGMLKVSYVADGNKMLHEILKLKPLLLFRKTNGIKHALITTFADASHFGVSEVYGQSGILSGFKMTVEQNTSYHPITWSSQKQRKVRYSSYGAEILRPADADCRGFHLKEVLSSLFPRRPLKHKLLVDSESLFETITTFHHLGDYRSSKIVARMRDSFEAKELNIFRWVPGGKKYADVLAKVNLPLSQKLNTMLTNGYWDTGLSESYALDADNRN